MAAVRPIVLVYQDFEQVSVSVALPDLNVLLAGPAYQVMDYATDKTSVNIATVGSLTVEPSGSATAGPTLTATTVPGLAVGATVDASSVVVFVDGGYAEIDIGSTGQIAEDQNTVTCSTATFVTNGVKPGDRIVVADIDGSHSVAKTVLAVASNTSLTTTTNFATDFTDILGAAVSGATLTTTATLKFRVERAVNSTKVSAATDADKTVVANQLALPTAISVTINSVDCPITYGKLYTQYRALRADLAAGISEISSTAELTATLGKIDERNPLAVATSIALQNSNKKIQVIGVSGDNLNSGTDLLTAHTAAKDAISGRKDVYCIVPLTSDLSVIEMWKNHVVAMSDPSVAKFRIVVGSGSLPVTQQMFPESGTASGTVETGGMSLLDNTATFITSGVAVGDNVVIAATKYAVSSVVSENRLSLATAATVGAATYTVERALSKTAQVDSLVATTTSLKSSRCTMVWPDACLLSGVSNAYTGLASQQPGYYIAAAVGGMVAGLPPHQGFTFIGIAGIKQVVHSNMYFDDDQVDALSSGGWYVVVQDTPTAIPYCVHELTTDTTTLESGELMVVKNFDYVSTTYRNTLVGFLGVYNVLPETMDFLRDAFKSTTNALKLNKYPKIGTPILDASITSIAALDGTADRVELYGSVQLPKPLNRIGLHLTA